MQQIKARGVPLAEFLGVKPMYGIKTGLNEAFLIDDATRADFIRDDPGCAEIIKPYLRGQDIGRWVPDWQGLWMVVLRSSSNHHWPWSESADDDAEAVFRQTYPSLYARMKTRQAALTARQDQGRYWWELRSCDYYGAFDTPKIVHADITWRPQFAYSDAPVYLLNTCYVWPGADHFVLAVLNSPLLWAFMWRHAQHGKDEALRLIYSFISTLPIADPTPPIRAAVEDRVATLLDLAREAQSGTRELLTWLRIEVAVAESGQRLANFADLSAEAFVTEVRKRRPKDAGRLTPALITDLTATHRHYAELAQARAACTRTLELEVSDLVNQAYRLSADEIELLWRTAPPRTPRF